MSIETSGKVGKVFREAWIAGVQQHYPGQPKDAYVTPWESTPEWERASAAAVYEQVRVFVVATGGQTSRLSREQRGQFVALCWIGQVLKHFPAPKPGYIADWDQMPAWQQETDADIFDRIEQDVQLADRIPAA